MTGRTAAIGITLLAACALAWTARAQSFGCEDQFRLDDSLMACYRYGPDAPPPSVPEETPDPFRLRALSYAALGVKHKLSGLASYYSSSLDGLPTATGEIFRNKRLSAAHLTLPLGTWVEIQARANGRKIRLRVNDRGPYAKKFILDLSQAAARALGVDVAPDRHVDIRVIALPGEEPLPEDSTAVSPAATVAAATPR